MQSTLWHLATFCAFVLSHSEHWHPHSLFRKIPVDSLKNCPQQKSSLISTPREEIRIMNVFSQKGTATTDPRFNAESLLVAFEMAIEDVNTEDGFTRYFLTSKQYAHDDLSENDIILDIMEELEKTNKFHFLIDATGSDLVLKMEILLKDHKVVHVATIFGHQAVLPYMSRMEPPAIYVADIFVKLFQSFNWTNIYMIYQDFKDYQLSTAKIWNRFKEANISIAYKHQLTTEVESSVLKMKEKKARVIVGLLDERTARAVLCAAYKLGLYGQRVAWVMFSMNYQSAWWKFRDTNISCSENQMDEIAEGLFDAAIVTSSMDTKPSISGQTFSQFWASYEARLKNRSLESDSRAPQVYDSVWAVALTMNCFLNTTISVERQTHAFNREITQTMQSLHFLGMSGPVAFDEEGFPLVQVWVNQVQKGFRVKVGLFDPRLPEMNTTSYTPIAWPTGAPTRDSVTKIRKDRNLPLNLYFTMCSLAAVGIALACKLLTYNATRRGDRIVRMSSPRLNYVILLGCVCVYTCVFIKEISAEHGKIGCIAYNILLCMGLAMTLSAVLVKVWRVYTIFTDIRVRHGALSDCRMLIIVAVVSTVMLLSLVTWEVFDPVQVTQQVTQQSGKKQCDVKTLEERDELVETCEKVCKSEYGMYQSFMQLGAVITFLVMGIFLSWQTRHVHIRELNDSRALALCVYSLAVVVVLYVLLSFQLGNTVEVKYGLRSTLLIVGATAIQCFIFLPQLTANRGTRPLVSHESPSPAVQERSRTRSLSLPRAGDRSEHKLTQQF